jgi:glycosyltransferase involved in cell wall biosynthesis
MHLARKIGTDASFKRVVLALPLASGGFSMQRYGRSLGDALKDAGGSWSIDSFRPESAQRANPKTKLRHLHDIYQRYVRYPFAVRHLNADVVHIMDHGEGHLLLALQRVKTVVTCHDLIPWLGAIGEIPVAVPRRVQYSVMARLRCLKLASHIVTDSKNTRADLLRLMPELETKISVVYPGIATAFRPGEQAMDRRQLRSKLAVEPDSRILLHVGQNTYKNVGKVIEILALLKTRVSSPLKLVVTSSLNDELRGKARELQVLDLILEVSAPSDQSLSELYRGADVFVFPSWYEGFGWPPLEAMASGLPVVASRAGSLAEVLGHEALLFDPSDTNGFVGAIEQLLACPQLARTQIAAGLKRAATYAWENTAKQMLEIYNGILAPQSP